VDTKDILQIEFLDALLSISNAEKLHSFVLGFFTGKFKLSNCTFEVNNKELNSLPNQSQKNPSTDVENRIIAQLNSMRAPFITNNLSKDFLFNGLKGLDVFPQNIVALPLLAQKDVIGHLICYSESSLKSNLELFSWLCSKLSIAIQRINKYYAIENSALTDGLTGLHNRIYFEIISNSALKARQEKLPTSIILFDIDNFKAFNDTQGHIAGDNILKSLGSLLAEFVPNNFSICRYGGEEFILFLPNTKGEPSFEFAEHMRTKISQTLNITVSVGVCSCLNSSVDVLVMVNEADTALYKAKNSGKNKTVQRIIVDKNLGVIDVQDASSVGKTQNMK